MDNGLRILNSFVIEHKREETQFSEDSFISNMKYLTEASVIDSKIINSIYDSTLYSKYITRATENMNTMRVVDFSYLDKFFSEVYESSPLEEKGITIGLQDIGEIEKIRPEYLSSIPVYFDTCLKDVLRGQKKKSDIDREILSEAFKDKLRKQLVKTTLTVRDTRDLMKLDSPKLARVNKEFICNNIIPFIRSYPAELEFMNKVSMQTIGCIGNTRADIVSSVNALNDMYAAGKLDNDKIYLTKYLAFNVQSMYMNLCAYISAMLIRKMAYYTYNMRSIQHLYNVIISYFPEAEAILHESVLDGDISDIESSDLLRSMLEDNLSIVIPKVHDTISRKKIEISNFAAKHMNTKVVSLDDINDHPSDYNDAPYTQLKQTFMQIANQLHQFELAIKDPDAVIDEIIHKLGLDTSYVAAYMAIVNKAKDTSAYDSMISNHMTDAATKSLYTEISNYETHINDICTTAAKVCKYIEALRKSYEVSSSDMNYPMYKEAVEVMDKILTDYKDYCLMVARALLARLDNLSHILIEDFDHNLTEYTKWPSAAGGEYEIMEYNIDYDQVLKESEETFTNLMKEYKAIKAKNDRGVHVVYEDENTVPATQQQQGGNNNGGSQPTNGSGNNNSGTNGNNNQNVKTASVQVDGKPTTKKETEEGSKDGTADASEKGIVQAFLDKLNSMLNNWSNKISELAKKNNKKLKEAQPRLQQLDTSKITITVADYTAIDLNNLNSIVNKAITNVNAINPDNLEASLKNDHDSAVKYIFPDLPTIQGAPSFKDSVKLYLIWGKNANADMSKNTLHQYTGDDAIKQLNNMMIYCLTYENMGKELRANLDKLDKATAEKQTAILNSQKARKSKQFRLVVTPVREFILPVLTVCEKKYFDYYAVLARVLPQIGQEAARQAKQQQQQNQNGNK